MKNVIPEHILESLSRLSLCKASDCEGEIPDVINFSEADTDEVTVILVEANQIKKFLEEKLEIVKSNLHLAGVRVGEDMMANGQLKFQAANEDGSPSANIVLDAKFRPSIRDKELYYMFLDAIGQGDCVQPQVHHKTNEKIVNDFLTSGSVPEGYTIEDVAGKQCIIKLEEGGVPVVICELFQTIIARITKMY